MGWISFGLDWIELETVGLASIGDGLNFFRLHGIVLDQSEGGYSLAKHPERVGTGPKDKKRLQIQLFILLFRPSPGPGRGGDR